MNGRHMQPLGRCFMRLGMTRVKMSIISRADSFKTGQVRMLVRSMSAAHYLDFSLPMAIDGGKPFGDAIS